MEWPRRRRPPFPAPPASRPTRRAPNRRCLLLLLFFHWRRANERRMVDPFVKRSRPKPGRGQAQAQRNLSSYSGERKTSLAPRGGYRDNALIFLSGQRRRENLSLSLMAKEIWRFCAQKGHCRRRYHSIPFRLARVFLLGFAGPDGIGMGRELWLANAGASCFRILLCRKGEKRSPRGGLHAALSTPFFSAFNEAG